MNWSIKRKFFYFSIFFIVVLFILFLFFRSYFNQEPTCFDGKQNGQESGLDCGGNCELFCDFEIKDLTVLWSRIFNVAGSRYNALAYIDNQNIGAGIKEFTYEFRFYDKNNIYIGGRQGKTFMAPGGRTAIFEPSIDLGNFLPERTIFNILGQVKWVKTDTRFDKIKLIPVSKNLLISEGKTKLTVPLKNESLYDVENVEVIVILIDKKGNAFAVSRTALDKINSGKTEQAYFTWPEEIIEKEPQIEVFYRINPFSVQY